MVMTPQNADSVAEVVAEQPVVKDSISIEEEKTVEQPLDTVSTFIIHKKTRIR
jgi:hypothetical protein